jgi:hypothetical protein
MLLQLDEEQSQRLVKVARELNVDASELAKAAINDLVSRPADDFERAATPRAVAIDYRRLSVGRVDRAATD